jgi:hypothetical protein
MKVAQDTNQSTEAKDKAREEKYTWKKIAPKDGEAKSKPYEDRTYHWCGKHKYWTIHTEAECTGVRVRGNHNSTSGTNHTQAMVTAVETKQTTPPAVKVAEALQSIVRFVADDTY